MIRAALLLSAVVCFLQPFRPSATGQYPERLVFGCDTMQLFALPLATADSAVRTGKEKTNVLSIEKSDRVEEERLHEDDIVVRVAHSYHHCALRDNVVRQRV